MTAVTHRGFFGDAEHAFTLTYALIEELENLTGAGIGALFRRLVARDFFHRDLLAVIRLGLIGGGMAPEAAARAVKVYGEERPLEELYPLAVEILSALWFGAAATTAPVPVDPHPEPVPAPNEERAETDAPNPIGSEAAP